MKTVLITGSSRGIGRETAIYFAQQGWNVIIHGFRHPEKLESLKNEILEENVSCLSFCGDISDPSFVDEMIKQSLLTFSKIDCLVNNAGISLVGLFTDATVDDWNLMINTNLTSVFTTDTAVIQKGADYLIGFAPETIVTAIMFSMVGFFNGYEKTVWVMTQGLIQTLLVRLPLAYVMSIQPNASLTKIALAAPIATCCGILLNVMFYFVFFKKQTRQMEQA